ncbi:hypothetical protein [Azospirillum thermophilum]|uniref:hypothetical protein n=1 Tax=Azospirillum thermophilum TaxID=2202148 RepID=UPI001FE3323A|nr:hypothetical protein [Azospirillum thermophilum]
MSVDPAALHAALTRLPGLDGLAASDLHPMPLKGVAHDHVRLAGRGLVARIPRWSQMGLDPAAALEHQATAFRRAEPCGHTPPLAAVLPPGDGLPMGALLVREIAGRPPRLPGDMASVARALAALHSLPLPAPQDRPPLPAPADPVAATLAVVERQAEWFARAGLSAAAAGAVAAELEEARRFQRDPRLRDRPMPVTAVGSDTHPAIS